MLPNWKSLQKTISNLMKMAENFPKGLKTLWEKEKLLVTSNFSFSRSVFKRLVLQTRKNQGLFGKGLSARPHSNMCIDWPISVRRIKINKLIDLRSKTHSDYSSFIISLISILENRNIPLEVNLKHKSRKQTTCLHLHQPFGSISSETTSIWSLSHNAFNNLFLHGLNFF